MSARFPQFPHTLAIRGALLVAAFAAVSVAACGGAPPAAARREMPVTLVQVATVEQAPIQDASEYVATVLSLSSTNIKPEVSGELTRILVRSGDRVAAGTPLFEIDPARQQASVSSQDAARSAQEASATFAKQQLDRTRTLFEAGAASQQDLQQAQANYDAAQAQLASLDARLHQERVTLKYYQVDAPSAGVVGDIPVRVGMRVTSDTVLTTIDRNQNLEVNVPVSLERAPDLRQGLPIEILDRDGAVQARTTVSFVSPRVDDETQSVLVKGRLSGDTSLRSSQLVRVRVIWKTTQGLVVPVLSVVRVNGQPFVFVAREQDGRLTASQRLVQLGSIIDNHVVVTNGLTAGERLVVSGVQKLADAMPIRTS